MIQLETKMIEGWRVYSTYTWFTLPIALIDYLKLREVGVNVRFRRG